MGKVRANKKFDRQFKIDAVNLVINGDKSVKAVAESLGVPWASLYRWVRQLNKDQGDAFPGKGRLGSQEEELRRLRRELEQAKEDRDILKKALEFFSKNGK
jgi:transposase